MKEGDGDGEVKEEDDDDNGDVKVGDENCDGGG